MKNKKQNGIVAAPILIASFVVLGVAMAGPYVGVVTGSLINKTLYNRKETVTVNPKLAHCSSANTEIAR
jgi:hypothetical protein